MSASSAHLWPPAIARTPRRLGSSLLVTFCAVAGAAVLVGAVVARQPELVRAVAAGIAVLVVSLAALRSPGLAVLTMLGCLPFLAFARRLLILFDGWQSKDPLLLVAPVIAMVLILGRRPRRGGRPSTLIRWLLVVAVLESVNPLGGSVQAGIVGLLFVAAPLLWFYVGRDVVDHVTMRAMIPVVVTASVASALYGLSQTTAGFPAWDRDWVQTTGYAALNVGGKIRAFAGFSSAAEYGAYVAAGLIICIALALHGRIAALVPVPLLAAALFLEGSRGILVLALVATVAVIGLRTRRIGGAAVVIAVIVGLATLTWQWYGTAAQSGATATGNAFVQHQVGGLAHPFDPTQSTLPAHLHLFVHGLAAAVRQPLGLGTGSTNIAGSRFGGVQSGTEVDISNAFVSLGLVGGCIFVGLVFLTLKRAVLLYRARGDVVVLAVTGVLLVALGQWLNGGFYALAPLVWVIAGWIEGRPGPVQQDVRATMAAA